jgi:hypothetical protein
MTTNGHNLVTRTLSGGLGCVIAEPLAELAGAVNAIMLGTFWLVRSAGFEPATLRLEGAVRVTGWLLTTVAEGGQRAITGRLMPGTGVKQGSDPESRLGGSVR